MYNPGDEGNLVQSAETLKTFAIMVGIFAEGDTLVIMPRLPWECNLAEITDFPVVVPDGSIARIFYRYAIERWKNQFKFETQGLEKFNRLSVSIDPLPNILCKQ